MQHHVEFELKFTDNTYTGKYFALEGIDGSGKTTQVEKLSEYFEKQGKEVFVTKEPTNGEIGLLIKKIISGQVKIPPASLQYLFAADRGVHLEEEVIPQLKSGKVVLSDRSFWSAVCYGIADLGLDESEKERLLVAYNILALYGGYLVPDKTFVINVPASVAIERIKMRNDKNTLYEKQGTLEKVQKEYVWLAGKFSDKLILIDGTKSVDEVFKQILKNI